jgi:2',3'-cyclic-nucleotide 2'-phosphodiesterase (5'-nucleotidase family)
MTYKRQFMLAWLLFLSACSAQSLETTAAGAGQTVITIIHLNDTYRVGDVEEGRRGGYGRIATIVRQLKAQGHDVRITHGGDLLYPSLESQL